MQLPSIKTVTFKFDDAEFTIKELLSGDLEDIKDRTMGVQVIMENIDGEISQKQTIEPLMGLSQSLKLRKSLVGWKNVKSEDGKDLVCDAAGKKTFCENLPESIFSEFYKKFSTEYSQMVEVIEKQKAKSIKN